MLKFEKLRHCLARGTSDCQTAGRNVKFRHNELFPNSLRALIVGPSNSGKTNLMLDLLTQLNGIKFKNLYIFSQTLHQPKYAFLRRLMLKLKDTISFFESSSVLEIGEIKNESVIILDDIAIEENIQPYFTRGRHKQLDVFYLVQSFIQAPKIVRSNVNFLIIFKTDIRSLKYIYDENYPFIHVVTSFKDFLRLCNSIWTKNKKQVAYDFITINKETFEITDSLMSKVILVDDS